jgi:hypothetical protein
MGSSRRRWPMAARPARPWPSRRVRPSGSRPTNRRRARRWRPRRESRRSIAGVIAGRPTRGWRTAADGSTRGAGREAQGERDRGRRRPREPRRGWTRASRVTAATARAGDGLTGRAHRLPTLSLEGSCNDRRAGDRTSAFPWDGGHRSGTVPDFHRLRDPLAPIRDCVAAYHADPGAGGLHGPEARAVRPSRPPARRDRQAARARAHPGARSGARRSGRPETSIRRTARGRSEPSIRRTARGRPD